MGDESSWLDAPPEFLSSLMENACVELEITRATDPSLFQGASRYIARLDAAFEANILRMRQDRHADFEQEIESGDALHKALDAKCLTFRQLRTIYDWNPSAVETTNEETGQTPLHIIVSHTCIHYRWDPEVLRLFLRHFPDSINIHDNKGKTPMQLALDTRSWNAVEVIISACPHTLEAIARDQATLDLIFAAMPNSAGVIFLLLRESHLLI
jgi:hypothetical protein